jgi:hypothetical protein
VFGTLSQAAHSVNLHYLDRRHEFEWSRRMARSKKLPAAAIVVGILNLLLYSPCLCCGGIGVVSGATGGGASMISDPKMKEEINRQMAFMENEVPAFKAASIGFNVAYAFVGVLLMVSGVLLFFKMPAARTACIIGSVLMLMITLAYIAHQAAFVLPAQFKWQQQNPAVAASGGAFMGILKGSTYAVLVGAAILYVGYPALALGLMMMSSVRQAFSGSSSIGPDDDFDDDRRRNEDDADRRRDDYDDRRRDG